MMIVKKGLVVYWIIHIIIADSLTVIKEAKLLFMEYDGDLELLKDDKKYYESQSSLEYEEIWLAELKEIKKNKAK